MGVKAVRSAALGLLGLAALFVGPDHVAAFSGDVFPGTPPDQLPTYTIAEGSCDAIRDAAGDPGHLSDLVVACSRNGDSSVCDLVSGGTDAVPVGQCVDNLPLPLTPVDPASATWLSNISLKGLSTGANTRFADRDRVSVTFAQVLRRVDIQPGAGTSASCNGINVADVSQATCNLVQGLVEAASGQASPPLSHLLLLDIQRAGQSDFLRVGVCPNFHSTCPAAEALGPTDYRGEMTFSVDYGSVCSTVNRKTICCATYPAPRAGVPIPPCPK